MSFLNRSDSGENTLVVDISSGSTAAALVHTHEHGLPEIVALTRTPFFLKEKPTEEALEAAMISSLRATLSNISNNVRLLTSKGYHAGLSKALISFSSPWTVSHLKTVIIAKDEGFEFDDGMLKAVMGEEKELFSSRLANRSDEEYEIFESAVTNLYLNGYEAQRVSGEKVKKAEATFLISAARKNLLWKVENELIKAAGIRRGVVMASFTYAYFKVLSHAFQNLHSALLINMTAESTDLLFLRHGNSALCSTLKFGPLLIARAVAEKLSIPFEVAHSYLSVFATGSFDQETTTAIDSVLLQVEEEWRLLWRNMGENIPEGSNLPYSVFLIVPEGSEKLMKTFLESVLPGKHITVLGETNAFAKELVKAEGDKLHDEALLVLSSFSNLLK